MKVFLYGTHSRRTPLAYAEYRVLFSRHFEYVSRPEDADVVVFGFLQDLRKDFQSLLKLHATKPAIDFVVLSEEPLWDSVWGGDFRSKTAKLATEQGTLEYTALNHSTTHIFDFENIPYYLTTDNDYFVRYAYLFERNKSYAASDIRAIWQDAPIRAAFYAENRKGSQYEVVFPDVEVQGLCSLRTEIAEKMEGAGVVRVGRGWETATHKRQDLPDWHLDKLAALDRKAFIVSGMENTHQHSYLTEKVCDAFAVLGVPLYVASPTHNLLRTVPPESFVNLWGLTAEDAVREIRSFTPTNAYLGAYRQAQSDLANLFSDAMLLARERSRVVAETVREMHMLSLADRGHGDE